jgi:hypothetical protein
VNTPYISSILDKIAAAKGRSIKSCLLAELAIYYVRTGKYSEAREIADVIRKSPTLYTDAGLYVWLCMLEGLTEFYQSASTAGIEKLLRAHSVAEAIGRVDLRQLAAAWLGHHCFNAAKYPEMAIWLNKSGLALADNTSAAIRATLTFADAVQKCNDNNYASYLYSIAREIATKAGDRASIMAGIENCAAIKLDRLWFEAIHENVDIDKLSQVENEVLGALSYERATRSESFSYQGLMLRARIEILKQNYTSAVELMTRSRHSSLGFDASLVWSYDAELSWAHYKIGNIVEAKQYLENARAVPSTRMDHDDAAVHWHRLSILDTAIGSGSKSIEYKSNSNVSAETYRVSIATLTDALSSIECSRSLVGS